MFYSLRQVRRSSFLAADQRRLAKQIDAITAADVRRGAQKYLHPESMVVIAVGDRARIGSELEKLQVGPVKQVP